MLTLLAYVYYTRAPSLRRYLGVALVFCVRSYVQTDVGPLPFVLLVLDYWPLRRIGRQTSGAGRRLFMPVLEKIPLIALSAVSSVRHFSGSERRGRLDQDLPLATRINNAVVSYVAYIWQMLWPVNLAVFYPHPETAYRFGNRLVSHSSNLHHVDNHRSAKTATLFDYGLVMVSGNACPGDWTGASRMAGPG